MKVSFKGKRITLMGLGLLGRGIGDARFLAEQGADVLVTDLKTEEELTDAITRLEGFSNISFRLGCHDLEDFRDRDMVIRAANVPLDSVYLKEAEKNNILITQSAALFAKYTTGTIIGVTGTRGKSTVTQMVYEIIKATGKTVFLGGNVRGVSTLSLLSDVEKDDYVVLELDSWQLQSFGDEKISPYIAVFTTFMPDHMNYYKNDLDWYLSDKANIFKYQTPEDIFIVGLQVEEMLEQEYSEDMLAKKYVASDADIPHEWVLNIPGLHNRYNAGIARSVARALDIKDDVIQKTLESFKGLPGRLELIETIKDVAIYNDTNSTTPDATLAALESFPKGKIVLITGGADKDLALDIFAEEIHDQAKGVVLLSGTGTEKLKELLEPGTFIECDNLTEAVNQARALASSGDTILFSPAFASFGMFVNEYDRGEKFVQEINKIC